MMRNDEYITIVTVKFNQDRAGKMVQDMSRKDPTRQHEAGHVEEA